MKVNRITQPDIAATDLLSTFQRINVPGNAFGENVGKEIQQFGGSIESSASQLAPIIARMQERKSISDANAAFKDVPVMAYNLLEDMKKNPGNLLDFDKSYLNALDTETNKIAQTITDKRTRERFAEKANSTRTSMAMQAITWKSREFIAQGIGNHNAMTDALISTAASNISALDADAAIIAFNEFQNRIGSENTIAEKAGFVRNGNNLTKENMESLSLTIANSMVRDQPLRLQAFLAAGFLQIQDKDKDKFSELAKNSLEGRNEQAEFTRAAYETAKHHELLTKIDNGTATATDITNSGLPDKAKDYWMRKYVGIEKPIKATKPTSTEKNTIYKSLIDEFREAAKLNKKDEVTGIKSLEKSLGLIDNVLDAESKGFITKAERDLFVSTLVPSLIEMIDSKYWEGQGKTIRLNSRFRLGGKGFRERNPFADHYNTALELLSQQGLINTDENKAIILAKVVKHIDLASKLENVKEQEQAMNNVARNAMIDIMREMPNLYPAIGQFSYDDTPTVITEDNVSISPDVLNRLEKYKK